MACCTTKDPEGHSAQHILTVFAPRTIIFSMKLSGKFGTLLAHFGNTLVTLYTLDTLREHTKHIQITPT